MTIRSIELSDKVYNHLKALKPTEESWDEFLLRIVDTIKTFQTTDQEWSDVYKKVFRDDKKTFKKLAN